MTSHPKSPGITGNEAGLFSISSSFSSSSSYRGLFFTSFDSVSISDFTFRLLSFVIDTPS